MDVRLDLLKMLSRNIGLEGNEEIVMGSIGVIRFIVQEGFVGKDGSEEHLEWLTRSVSSLFWLTAPHLHTDSDVSVLTSTTSGK